MTDAYHHGHLRDALLNAAADAVAASGTDAVSLRSLARDAGVSHSAPVHHFGTRQGLLTELATEGFVGLEDALACTGDLHAKGRAYVEWALAHPGHYAVMWQGRLLNDTDQRLDAARRRAWASLEDAVRGSGAEEADVRQAAYGAFAMVHGLASMWLSEAVPPPADRDAFTRDILARLVVATPNPSA